MSRSALFESQFGDLKYGLQLTSIRHARTQPQRQVEGPLSEATRKTYARSEPYSFCPQPTWPLEIVDDALNPFSLSPKWTGERADDRLEGAIVCLMPAPRSTRLAKARPRAHETSR